tara:strand:+ start:577 stop:750 length:174 start_codon:yes stop_codon:yes gene_type:complete
MSVKSNNSNTITYINFVTNQIHNHADDIYEALMDQEDPDLQRSVDSLIDVLLELKTK